MHMSAFDNGLRHASRVSPPGVPLAATLDPIAANTALIKGHGRKVISFGHSRPASNELYRADVRRLIRPAVNVCAAGVIGLFIAVGGSFADERGARAQIEQKLALTRSYLESETASSISESGNNAARSFLDTARQYFEQATEALHQGRLLAAQDKVNLSLQSFTAAGTANLKQAAALEHQRHKNRSTRAEIDAYLQSLAVVSAEKDSAIPDLLDEARLSDLLDSAEQADSVGDHASAANSLRDARQLVIDALIKTRNNETVVYTVEFDTPADEFRYEQERFREYTALADKMIDSAEIETWRVMKFEHLKSSGERLRNEALALFDEGDYDAAIVRIEIAVKQLVQGLQVLGVALSM